jgi:hypothetical protein
VVAAGTVNVVSLEDGAAVILWTKIASKFCKKIRRAT